MKYLTLCAALLMLAACGASPSDEQSRTPPRETVFDPMTSQLDRAKQQAETLPQERKENLDKAIEGDAP